MFTGNGKLSDLPDFLTYLVSQGLLKGATAQTYRTAIQAVLEHDNALHLGCDVREFGVEAWCLAFDENNDELSQSTKNTYNSRFRKSVELYRQWLDDPKSMNLSYRGGPPEPVDISQDVHIHIHIHLEN